MKALENVRKFTTLKLVLLVLLVFCCQMIFLGLAGDVEMDASLDIVELAGVGWTDLMPVWFFNLFAANDAVETTAGVGWTDLLPVWFFNLFASNDVVVTTAGVGWTDLLPVWFWNFLG